MSYVPAARLMTAPAGCVSSAFWMSACVAVDGRSISHHATRAAPAIVSAKNTGDHRKI